MGCQDINQYALRAKGGARLYTTLLQPGGRRQEMVEALKGRRRIDVTRDERLGLDGSDEPIPLLERSPLVTLEIAVRPSGEIRISKIVVVGWLALVEERRDRGAAGWKDRADGVENETSIYIALTNQASRRFK